MAFQFLWAYKTKTVAGGFGVTSERMITTAEIREAVLLGEVIEDYPVDRRGASCLVSYVKQGQALHVVCAPKSEYLAIITAYWPAPDQWSSDFKVRK